MHLGILTLLRSTAGLRSLALRGKGVRMKRIDLLLAMAAIAALMLAATAFPAAAAAPAAGCPTGFVEKEQPVPDSYGGSPSTAVNTTEQDCFKELEHAPQQLKDHFGVETVYVIMDDVVRYH